MSKTWTIDQLAERVAEVLAADPVGPTSGRVRDVPDRRAIRWYTTIGLLDRPYPTGGRVAHYGRRHLLQIVAIKRRQAQGRSLASIQAELVGAPDEQLAAIARIPAGDADRAADLDGAPDLDAAADTGEAAVSPRRDRSHFWRETPAATPQPSIDTAHPAAGGIRVEYSGGGHQTDDQRSRLIYGVPIAPGVTLLLDVARPPDDGDTAVIRTAAAPVLELLRRRALLPTPPATVTVEPEPSLGRQP